MKDVDFLGQTQDSSASEGRAYFMRLFFICVTNSPFLYIDSSPDIIFGCDVIITYVGRWWQCRGSRSVEGFIHFERIYPIVFHKIITTVSVNTITCIIKTVFSFIKNATCFDSSGKQKYKIIIAAREVVRNMTIQGIWLPSFLFIRAWWWPTGIETCSIFKGQYRWYN